ncbi:hypothetical protein G7046_g8679 [Stylonectria norvegica]|nr:hypothetical protein G7046_g8679 [Stylonectria norvegica]
MEALDGHVERGGEGGGDAEMMAMAACSFAGLGTAEEQVKRAVRLLDKIQTNAFHRYDADLGQVGIFLEPTLAMANHSCMPNAMVQFVGREAILRAETDIQAGQEIEISYTDYTYPLSRRREALAPYNFVCQCPRCSGDLNVYQACAISTNIDLNRHGLVLDVSRLRSHPAATRDSKIALARRYTEDVAGLIDSEGSSSSLNERRRLLEARYRKCKQLVSEQLWAVAPLPQILTETSIYYAEQGDLTRALTTACYVATSCDPYRYVAPFHPVRAKGLFLIAKLLANTAADTAALGNAVVTLAAKGGLDQKALETLQRIDQVSLCQMLLIMVLRAAPGGYVEEWELSVSAREMLDDINQLPGRDQEVSLIDAWRQNPETDQSRAFFEYAVLKQVDALAELGLGVLTADFGL